MADDLSEQFDLVPKFETRKRKIDESPKKEAKKKKKEKITFAKDSDKKKKHKKKPKKEEDDGTPTALTASSLISAIDTHYKAVLSPLELEKIQLQDSHFSVCNDQTHTTVSLFNTIMPRVKKTLASNGNVPGRPVVVVLCSSGLRCVAFIKQLQEFKSDACVIAKLFAKHLKLDKTQQFLKSKVIHIAVGTPHRINMLLNNGDISLQSTQHIILDLTYRDAKKMNMLQIKIVKEDLMELLSRHVIPHVKKSNNNNNDNKEKKVNKSKAKDGIKGDKNDSESYPCKLSLF